MNNIEDAFLTINQWSRSGKIRPITQALIIHWFENAGQSAHDCQIFYENRKYGKTEYGGAHYLIGLDGEILHTIPDNEIAYNCGTSKIDPVSGKYYTDLARAKFGNYAIDHVNQSPNSCTISIECSHIDWNGTMTEKTMSSLKELAKSICDKYQLNPDQDVLLHKEVVGWKDCHKYFVLNPDKWAEFKASLK
jgi:N-acetylmuramoyl-L-alanine amidase